MKEKTGKNLFYILLVVCAVLLGLTIQLLLWGFHYRQSASQAGNAFEAFSELALSEAERDKGAFNALTAGREEALEANTAAKALRSESLSELDLLTLVNPWNPIPEGYTMELSYLDDAAPWLKLSNEDEMVDSRCVDALAQMMTDCHNAGMGLYLCSAYRPHEKQIMLYEDKIARVMADGFSAEEAPEIAARSVAVPGTSEHELGLAVDIIDVDYPYLNEWQMDTDGQQWLMEHCWDYGFILRFPEGTSDITGIIFEPWHYRYVGKEYAAEIKELGVTLEEYVAMRRGR